MTATKSDIARRQADLQLLAGLADERIGELLRAGQAASHAVLLPAAQGAITRLRADLGLDKPDKA